MKTKKKGKRAGRGKSSAVLRAIVSFADALERSRPRPTENAHRDKKKNYAQRLSNNLAILLANKLRPIKPFGAVLPESDGSGTESGSASGTTKKAKRTDVRYATATTGLELLVSIKTLNFRDTKTHRETGTVTFGRYTKNMVRNDHELRAEAMDHHERFPYAVMVALFFLPVAACDDGENDKSSFAHAVVTFRPRAGRSDPSDPAAKFERLFIGLYEQDGSPPSVGFVDVMKAPPRRGRPPWPDEQDDPVRGGKMLTLDEVIAEIVREYGIRNRTYIRWADEAETGKPPVVVVEANADETEENEVNPDSQ